MKWTKSKYTGVRYREHETRKIGRVQKDRYYSVRYTVRGKCVESGLGWHSEGISLEVAIERLRMFRQNAKLDNGQPTKMKEVYSVDAAERLQDITIGDFIGRYYLPYAGGVKSADAVKKESEHCSCWIVPVLGSIHLKDLALSHIVILKTAMETARKSARLIEYVMATLRQVYQHGQRMEIIPQSARYPAIKLKVSNQRQRYLTKDEARHLLQLLSDRDPLLALMAEFSLLTGCRWGELISCKWMDVSLDTASILIRDPKNRTDRHLYLNARAIEIIGQQPPGQPSDCVFRQQSGRPYEKMPRSWLRSLDESGLNAGIADSRLRIVWHTLRHTAASWLAIQGVDLFKISKILGHRDLSTTQRYAHLSERSIRDAVEGVTL